MDLSFEKASKLPGPDTCSIEVSQMKAVPFPVPVYAFRYRKNLNIFHHRVWLLVMYKSVSGSSRDSTWRCRKRALLEVEAI